MPLYELGRNAMRAIYELITQGKVEDITVTDPPPELIVRGSTAPPRST
jgi:LacI family transcriptional regulator